MAKDKDIKRIDQAQLEKAVHKAVQIASKKHKVRLERNLFERDSFLLPWWIVGRRAAEVSDLDSAFAVAEGITRDVAKQGLNIQPVALKLEKDILVGFIERHKGQILADTIGGGGGPLA